MRLDYTLYGLAIIFFVVAAISMVAISDPSGKMLLAISTTVIGLVSASTGFILKPKVQTAASTPAPAVVQEVAAEPTPQAAVPMETPIVDAPKTETAPLVKVPAVVEAHQAEVPPVEAPVVSEVVAEAPVAASEPVAPAVEVVALTEASLLAPVSIVTPSIDLTQVKGIGEKRATQLKANGINSVEGLAKADAADLALKLKVSPKIIEKWIAGAKDLTK